MDITFSGSVATPYFEAIKLYSIYSTSTSRVFIDTKSNMIPRVNERKRKQDTKWKGEIKKDYKIRTETPIKV